MENGNVKNLKCESCGATLTIDEKGEYGDCSYCGAKYKLKKDVNLNITIDENVKDLINGPVKFTQKISMGIIIAVFITFIVVISSIIMIALNIFNADKKVNSSSNDNDIESSIKHELSVNAFNNFFEMYKGTQSKFFIDSLIDEVSTRNKTTNIRTVYIKFNDVEYSKTDELITLKNSLLDKTYEIVMNYDDKGYIKVIDIIDMY